EPIYLVLQVIENVFQAFVLVVDAHLLLELFPRLGCFGAVIRTQRTDADHEYQAAQQHLHHDSDLPGEMPEREGFVSGHGIRSLIDSEEKMLPLEVPRSMEKPCCFCYDDRLEIACWNRLEPLDL